MDHYDLWLNVTAVIGIALWIIAIGIFTGRAVYRDQRLGRGIFMFFVVILVIFTPSAITGIIEVIANIHNVAIDASTLYDTSDKTVNKHSMLWAVYYHFVDPGNQHDAQIGGGGRIIVGVISMLGILLLNGLLITTLINWFQQREERWRNGEIRYSGGWINGDCSLKNYTVIIGGNKMVAGIIKQIAATERYIIILTQRDADEFRRELFSILPKEFHDKLIIYCGDCTSEEEIGHLKLEEAKEIYILGEPSNESNNNSYHDTVNMRCLHIIAQECKKKNLSKKKCRVMFEHQTTFSAFQFTELGKEMNAYIDFKPFNYYETWAQQVLVNHNLHPTPADKYLPLEGCNAITKESEDFVHLVIIGMTRMGYALAIEAAHLAHYPNYVGKKKRTRITFIDPKAQEEMTLFTNRFKDLFALSRSRYIEAQQQGVLYQGSVHNLYTDTEGWFDPFTHPQSTSPYKSGYLGVDFIDIEWEFIQGSIQWHEIQQYLADAVNAPHSRVTIAACQHNNNEAVATAIYLQSEALAKAQQILVYQRHDSSIINSLNSANSMYHIRAFGMESECFDVNHTLIQEYIADKVGETYYEALLKNFDLLSSEDKKGLAPQLGKSSSASYWSNIYNANTMWSKLRSIEYVHGNGINEQLHLDTLKQVEHNRWNVEQLLLRFQPVTEQEQKYITNNDTDIKGKDFLLRKEAKKRIMRHLNICSWDRLNHIDADAHEYDKILTEILPQCYGEIQQFKKSIK